MTNNFLSFFHIGRLADELRNEQDHGMAANKAAKSLSAQSMELQGRLDEVEENAVRHAKKILAKLEERVRALEGELGKIQSGCHLFFAKEDARIKIPKLFFSRSKQESNVVS